MKKIEAIIRPFKLDEVRDKLNEIGVKGMAVTEVKELSEETDEYQFFLGKKGELIPKTRIEVVVPDYMEEEVVEAIMEAAYTGRKGDGKIFVTEVVEAVRIRTGETGEDALL